MAAANPPYFNHVGDVEGAENLLMPVVPACLEGGGAPPTPAPSVGRGPPPLVAMLSTQFTVEWTGMDDSDLLFDS